MIARLGADCANDCDFGIDSSLLSRCTSSVVSGMGLFDELVRFCIPFRTSTMRSSTGDSIVGCADTGEDTFRDMCWAGPGQAIEVGLLGEGLDTFLVPLCLLAR